MTMTNISKIDPSLILAMQLTDAELNKSVDSAIGFEPTTNSWRLIIKYGGDLNAVAAKYNAEVEILTDKYAIVTIAESHIYNFSAQREIEYIEKPKQLDYQINRGLHDTCISQVVNSPPDYLDGDGVLIGIIDSGISYRHPDFQNPDGTTRILRLWDQAGSGTPPDGFATGCEYTDQDLNRFLQNSAYQSTPLPSADLSGHGTMVAGIAAGNGRSRNGFYQGVAPKASLAVVKLGPIDSLGYPIKNIDVMRGIKYLVSLARDLDMPLALNLSYGSPYGGRDGTGLFETYIDDIALEWKTILVTGTGNNGASMQHAEGDIYTTPNVSFVINGLISGLALEIWKSGSDSCHIEIIFPDGQSTRIVPALEQAIRYRHHGQSIVVLYTDPTPINRNDSIHIEIISDGGYLDDGIWSIRFHDLHSLFGKYDIWMHGSACEACNFLNPSAYNTITLPATAQNVISVAAYDYKTGKIADFSGRGNYSFVPAKPDIAAPGVNIHTTGLYGGYEIASGTSIAAPFVTGACALLMQWGIIMGNDPYMYGNRLKNALLTSATRDYSGVYPNSIWGYGKLCLHDTLGYLTSDFGLAQFSENTAPLSTEQKITSEDFIDFFVEKNTTLLELAKDNPDIIIGYEYDLNSVIVHVHRRIINEVIRKLTITLTLSYPLLFGILDIDSLNASGILPINYHPTLSLNGKGVLIGIIDTGIDYTHPAFIDSYGNTRIKALWDQTILTENPPDGFLFGTEYTEEQINKAIRSDAPFEIVPSQDEIGHGTFLAGIVAGNEPEKYLGAAPEATLLCVKLAPAKKYAKENSMLFDDNAIAFQETNILQGVSYLISTAQTLGMPLSILLGVGSTQGSHEGLSYGQMSSRIKGISIASACGNEGNTMTHAMGIIDPMQGVSELELHIADGEQGIAVYLWGYAPDKISVGLVSPSNEVIERVPVRNANHAMLKLIFYDTTIWIDYYAGDINGDQLAIIRLKNPEPGLWTIKLHGDIVIDGRYHAWLPLRNWISRSTYFMNPSSEYTITEFGNSTAVISTGAYNHINQHLFIESSKGPSRSGIIRPDLIAPGVNITGPIPGHEYASRSGTSMAAAHVAGAAALLLQWGIVEGNKKDLNIYEIRSILISGARRRSGITYPNTQYGYGELDLFNAFREMNTNAPIESHGFYLSDELF